MIICIADLLRADHVAGLRAQLAHTTFVDGRATAGWHAQPIKHNRQADRGAPGVGRLQGQVREALESNPLFQLAARPRALSPILFSRYEPGMEYGPHVDDALMGAGERRLRTDIALTLFLSDPETYRGGSLVIESTGGQQSYKLDAGSLVLYPATTLHRVEPVTRGTRLAAVAWVQSLVRDPARRELLFDLDTVRRTLYEREGKSTEFDLLSKSVANLMRMWADV
ncbi:MAG: Fe2+-dependent dioxygenase [Gammaproteobacteria bacterium]|nr:Fe2+-dependent dioxygenase [Gammaproteobacteria bacterium]NIR83427.1 Fe2+-dependent dioxygenase [Gammaproteobacteria bacterium]NIR91349.1 Fe2+-dependent dioxygenase [Gammaproteobacteria bacterium]NIU04589.1 Fe2+-dependent dioxygenase [Gammaproteobacteria bacterium]NIV51631.1 Fe2+-dependent dioxygenase [Gammaproteobacteria bacterium]